MAAEHGNGHLVQVGEPGTRESAHPQNEEVLSELEAAVASQRELPHLFIGVEHGFDCLENDNHLNAGALTNYGVVEAGRPGNSALAHSVPNGGCQLPQLQFRPNVMNRQVLAHNV